MESIFKEVNINNENVQIGYIYRHSSMDLSEFESDYLTNLLTILSSENKTIDFSLFLPHIFSQNRTIATSATLIDNIFTNNYNFSFISGNLINTLSDHYAHHV